MWSEDRAEGWNSHLSLRWTKSAPVTDHSPDRCEGQGRLSLPLTEEEGQEGEVGRNGLWLKSSLENSSCLRKRSRESDRLG